jgi:hypothetical protein
VILPCNALNESCNTFYSMTYPAHTRTKAHWVTQYMYLFLLHCFWLPQGKKCFVYHFKLSWQWGFILLSSWLWHGYSVEKHANWRWRQCFPLTQPKLAYSMHVMSTGLGDCYCTGALYILHNQFKDISSSEKQSSLCFFLSAYNTVPCSRYLILQVSKVK